MFLQMATHTFSPENEVNCSSVLTRAETIDAICDEIKLTSTINSEIVPVLAAVQPTTQITLDPILLSDYAQKRTEELPVRVKAVICAQYGC